MGYFTRKAWVISCYFLGNWELLNSEARRVGSRTEVERVLWASTQIRFGLNSPVKPQDAQIYEEAGAVCKARRYPETHPKLVLHKQEPVALIKLGEGGGDVRDVTSKREANS